MKSGKASHSQDSIQDELIQLIQRLYGEIHPQHKDRKTVTIDSSFEKNLGLDSLARAELLLRVEKHFGLALPESIFAEAESVRDLLSALQDTSAPRVSLGKIRAKMAKPETVDSFPQQAATLLDVLNWHVSKHPDRPHIQIYSDAGDGEVISYLQLRREALQVASGLQQRGIKSQEPVAIMLPSSTGSVPMAQAWTVEGVDMDAVPWATLCPGKPYIRSILMLSKLASRASLKACNDSSAR